mgnify:CR=1 FL=1
MIAKGTTSAKKASKKKLLAVSKLRLRDEHFSRKKEIRAIAQKDLELTSLHERTLKVEDINSIWSAVDDMAVCFQQFIRYNRASLEFLDITCEMSTVETALILKASQMVGCAPLISPVTGKQCGNIVVKSEYQDDIDGLVPVINGDIDLRYRNDLPLNKSPLVHPPIYMECIRYVDKYLEAKKHHWQKFANIQLVQCQPAPSTDWEKYAKSSYDPANRLKYPNRQNRLINNHPEWLELTYVLSVAISVLESHITPVRTRVECNDKIVKLKTSISYNTIRPVREVHTHVSDPQVIKELKEIANNILRNQSSVSCAWAFNITKFFERYVQYIFKMTMNRNGGHVICNKHFNISGQTPTWCLKYIEPDVILHYDGKMIIADAKYKSHMMNINSDSDYLRDTFREDLHQVLAYSSLTGCEKKKILFCYPCPKYLHRQFRVTNPLNGLNVEVFLLGVPVNKEQINETISYIQNYIIND